LSMSGPPQEGAPQKTKDAANCCPVCRSPETPQLVPRELHPVCLCSQDSTRFSESQRRGFGRGI
jgi:hypothetical protein